MFHAMSIYILVSIAGCSSVLAFGNPLFDGNRIGLTTRISGGTETSTYAYPYVVELKLYFPDTDVPIIHDELRYTNSGTCTGSIVHELVVVTAAHCIDRDALADTKRSYILVGASKKNDPNAIKIQVKKIMPHPDYVNGTVIGDIGLVFARQSLLKDRKGIIVSLASYSDFHYKEYVKLLGWGLKSFSGEETTQLMQCTMWSIPCGRKNFGDPAQYFCMESYSSTPLMGDSGGPVVTANLAEKLIGVISGGDAPPDQNLEDHEVFRRICEAVSLAYYHDWIVDHFPREYSS